MVECLNDLRRANGPAVRFRPSLDDEAAPLPFAGFDRLDARQVVNGLSDHSQVELTAVENFERANQNRQAVLDKLRFMRQPEPLPDYDALSPARSSPPSGTPT